MKASLYLLGFIALACTALCVSATSPSHFRSRLQKMRFASSRVSVQQSEVVLHGLKLVSQTHFKGERLGDHDHHCFLAAVLTVANHLAPDQERTMNDYWEKLVRLAGSPKALKSELADDRIRRTFSKIAPNKHTFENLYYAAMSYNPTTPNKKGHTQLEIMWTALSNGWPIIFGIGAPSTNAAEIGHYVVLAGARRNAHHVVDELLIYDPWWFTDREQTEEPGEKRKDGGKWLPVPEVGAGLALRASNGWAILEVYLPTQLERPAAEVMRERSDKLRGPARAPAPVARGAADKDAKDKSAKEKAAARF